MQDVLLLLCVFINSNTADQAIETYGKSEPFSFATGFLLGFLLSALFVLHLDQSFAHMMRSILGQCGLRPSSFY
jgi:hypothetical protein